MPGTEADDADLAENLPGLDEPPAREERLGNANITSSFQGWTIGRSSDGRQRGDIVINSKVSPGLLLHVHSCVPLRLVPPFMSSRINGC